MVVLEKFVRPLAEQVCPIGFLDFSHELAHCELLGTFQFCLLLQFFFERQTTVDFEITLVFVSSLGPDRASALIPDAAR